MILIANLVQQWCGGTKVYRKETIKLNYSPKRLPQKHYTSVESVADTHTQYFYDDYNNNKLSVLLHNVAETNMKSN